MSSLVINIFSKRIRGCLLDILAFLLFMALLLTCMFCMDIHSNPGPENINDLNICHLNIRNLRNKIDYLEDFAADCHILRLTETHLTDNISATDICIEGFQSEPYHNDRVGAAGGGVSVYTCISPLICARRRFDLGFPSGEIIWLEVKLPQYSFLLCAVYRPSYCINPFSLC